MNKYLNEILSLSQKLILQWSNEGVNPKEGQDAVLVLIKEYMNPSNPSIEDCKECITGLKMLLK